MKYCLALMSYLLFTSFQPAMAGNTCSSVNCGDVQEVCYAALDLDPVSCGLYYGCHCNESARTSSDSCGDDPCAPGCASENCSLSAQLALSTGKPSIKSNTAPAVASAGVLTVLVAKEQDGSVSYNWWNAGQGARGWFSLGGMYSLAPAVALDGNYAFVIGRGIDGTLYLNQGEISKPFVGWRTMNFSAQSSPTATASKDISVVAALDRAGHIEYTWWDLGKAGAAWKDVAAPVAGASRPAAALVDHYLFLIVRGNDDVLYLNQGELGGAFVGWQSMNFRSSRPVAAASDGQVTVVVASDPSGNFFYTWWSLGESAGEWVKLVNPVVSNSEPAISITGRNVFISVTTPDGTVRLNQGVLGGAFTGWR
jgi:hypothetical protein